MKAFLLTAGLGTRLHPITLTLPKCLVPIAGKPLINWWFESMQKAGVTEVLINLHHLPDMVMAHVNALDTNIKATYAFEPELLGSAGTLITNKIFVADQKAFFIIYADNLTNTSLSNLYDFHVAQLHAFTMALFETNNPTGCGIVSLNSDATITSFEEKPANPTSNLANAGLYVASPEIISLIDPAKTPADIGFDVLPLLVNKMSGYKINDYLIDIGTHQNLEKARKEFPLLNS
jgi:mannose-1-phosphate guanylyltransferase